MQCVFCSVCLHNEYFGGKCIFKYRSLIFEDISEAFAEPAHTLYLCDRTLSLFVLQVKVMIEPELLAIACEQFLGKTIVDIKCVLLQTLEGHLRSILGMDK